MINSAFTNSPYKIQENIHQYAVKNLFHHCISKFGPPQYLIGNRGTEYLNCEKRPCCTQFNYRHNARTSHDLLPNGLVEVKKKLEMQLRKKLHGSPRNWSIQVHFSAYAHRIHQLSHLQVTQREDIFHSETRIPMNFTLYLFRIKSFHCTAQYCSDTPPHSH